ncbi:MAG: type II toxin-antitoxin system VapC family toxin [Gemmatimonadales bacterium]
MRFWDSSALVPLCLAQRISDRARKLYDEDPELVVWWGSPVECASALARLRREAVIDEGGEADARAILGRLAETWYEVQPGTHLRDQAVRLLRIHPLRAADALQLAAALDWSGPAPSGGLVSFDDRLNEAARREGFATP